MSETKAPVTFTDAAIRKVLEFVAANEEAAGKSLRLYVEGGGCSGLNYRFELDNEEEDDNVSTHSCDGGDITFLIDSFSFPFLNGAEIDYVDDFSGSGFHVRNPNATGTCGCGESFTT